MSSIQRVRIVFTALAFVLLVPLALLIQRALSSERAEQERSHETVAERVFDELERELTLFLRREEERPFDHYRYFVLPSNTLSSALELERSPLAELPTDPFVVGYFQIEPDGSVTSPLRPDGSEAEMRVELVTRTVRDHWQSRMAGRSENDELQEAAADGKRARWPRLAVTPALEEEGRGTALGELNRAAADRQQRRTKLSQTPAANAYNFSSEASENVLQQELSSKEVVEGERRGRAGARFELEGRGLEEAVEASLQKKANEPVDVRLEPMVGREVNGRYMLLYRTVVIDRAGYRQGVLLDVPELVRWLAARVLASNELSRSARLVPEGEDGIPPVPGDSFVFRHRFAEPFGPVTGVLSLASLRELAGSSYLYSLSALLLLAATVGLFAVYRMVAVAMTYAERRQNFASAVSHELKTPLTAIRMYGEMLRDKLVPSEEKRQRYYEVITAETERLTRLVDNVLELGRLERKERSFHTVIGDVRPVVEETLAILGPHAESEGFQIRMELDPEVPKARFDPDALSQVVFNLVDNAIKYARHAAERKVLVSCKKEDAGVRLEVIDSGPGVDPCHLSGIFEPFYRIENENTRTSKGTGIGLALVKGLVEKMGGSVRAHNRAEGGFVVTVTLKSS